ncbi:MAG: GNAT family N-acetyltransferase [Coxiellaceae bacterium]|nr:GNAT family N-acetyltransferase [Coxiellaceae bacterium]
MKWQWQTFESLNNQQLYQLLQLRSAVFVVEQQCIYQDLDGIDQQSWHLLGYEDEQLVVYLRIFIDNNQSVIGRIVTAQSHRGKGLGKEMMQQAMDYIQLHNDRFPQKIYLMAQHYLEGFYQSFGFETTSEPFDEDGIPHIDMLYSLVEDDG